MEDDDEDDDDDDEDDEDDDDVEEDDDAAGADPEVAALVEGADSLAELVDSAALGVAGSFDFDAALLSVR